jgi:hypothetical protein
MQPIFGCWKNMEVGSVATASETHTTFLFGNQMSKVYDIFGLYKQVAPQTFGRCPDIKVSTYTSRKNDQNCKTQPSSEPRYETRWAMYI